jgi:hypothetical protein
MVNTKSEQLVIPGMESLAPVPRQKRPGIRQEIAELQSRLLRLELELTLLRIQVEKDEGHTDG